MTRPLWLDRAEAVFLLVGFACIGAMLGVGL